MLKYIISTFIHINIFLKRKIIIVCLAIVSLVSIITTYTVIRIQSKFNIPDPNQIINVLLFNSFIFLGVVGVFTYRSFKYSIFTHGFKAQTLKHRIITIFSMITIIPTITISAFSIYFFYFGILSWFSKKISYILEQSVNIADLYVAEHTQQLKENALILINNLMQSYNLYDLKSLNDGLNEETSHRLIDEAIILDKATNTIIARTSMSFSLLFINIPNHIFSKADDGYVVPIKLDINRIRVIVKFKNHDIYLIIGRFISDEIANHITKTSGISAEYYNSQNRIIIMQIKFALIFICITIILLCVSISLGIIFAMKITEPIEQLVIAANKVKDGDLTAQVPETQSNDNEIAVLLSTFNIMVQQINKQQRELSIAQQALVWSNIARSVAHEIKNPLTPIQLAAERILRKFINEVSDKVNFTKYINIIINHTKNITLIVSEFVNFVKFPACKLEEVDIVSFIKDITYSRNLTNEKIDYSFSSNNSSIDFICDPNQLSRAMINLLKNAEESLENSTMSPKIAVSINHVDDMLTITVDDNGRGFDSNISQASTKINGMGLGLVIVRRIMSEHHGSLEILNRYESSVVCGASVKLIFDIKELRNQFNLTTA